MAAVKPRVTDVIQFGLASSRDASYAVPVPLSEKETNSGDNLESLMDHREEQKKQREKTSVALMDAAIDLSAREGYASLSLRSVARNAGIAPTSFYRHFRDMDELGLALAERAGDALMACMEKARTLIRKEAGGKLSARSRSEAGKNAVRPFVDAFVECLAQNPALLYLLFQERAGSATVMREAAADMFGKAGRMLGDETTALLKKMGYSVKNSQLLGDTLITLAAAEGRVAAVTGGNPEDLAQKLMERLALVVAGSARGRGSDK